jgi:hypothetical protein
MSDNEDCVTDCSEEYGDGISEFCGVCGDEYSLSLALAHGCGSARLCIYHYDRRFGGYDSKSDDELDEAFESSTGVDLRPRAVFASQVVDDFSPEELGLWQKKVDEYDSKTLLLVTEDAWYQSNDDEWFNVEKGRTGVDCLIAFLAAPILNDAVKAVVCHFLRGAALVARVDGIFRFQLSTFLVGKAWKFMAEDVEDGTDGHYLDYYYGISSVCRRCGEIKPKERVTLIRFGVCMRCYQNGLRFMWENEDPDHVAAAFSVFPDNYCSFRIILAALPYEEEDSDELRVVRTVSVDFLSRYLDLEWPALEHPEWFATAEEKEAVVVAI